MHYNLRPPEPRQPYPALITMPCQVWRRSTYPLPYYSVLLLIHYFTLSPRPLTLWPWPLTFDLEQLQRIVCDVMKLCTKFERNRTIRGGVIAISVFDLMTLNIALRIALGSGIIFTKFDLRRLICVWIIAFFDDDTLCYAMTFIFHPLTLKIRGTSRIIWSKSVRNLCEFEQSPVELLIIWWFFLHTLCHGVTFTFDLLTLNFYSTSDVMCLNSLQNLSEIDLYTAEL